VPCSDSCEPALEGFVEPPRIPFLTRLSNLKFASPQSQVHQDRPIEADLLTQVFQRCGRRFARTYSIALVPMLITARDFD
ncbi:MAG TPA: hypothetical protein VF906_08840, partial [Candidatus Bathyarchaeia archaeon]